MKTKLTRREVIQSLAAGFALAALPRTGSAAESPAASAGGFRHSVCKWCYKDIPLAEFAAAVKEFGIESVELLNPADWKNQPENKSDAAMLRAFFAARR